MPESESAYLPLCISATYLEKLCAILKWANSGLQPQRPSWLWTECYERGEIWLGEPAARKKPSLSPAWDTLSGLYCLECDCSLSFLFTPSLLGCHNGSRPGLDGGEMGVIKSDPQGAMCRCHMYGDAISLWYCRRMLLHCRNAAGDTYNYMTSRTLKGRHPQTAAVSACRCVCVRAGVRVRLWWSVQ